MKTIPLFVFWFTFGSLIQTSAAPSIVPLPNEVTVQDGTFNWNVGTPIQAPAGATDGVALLRIYMGPLVGPAQAGAPIVFELSPNLSGEAYELEITPEKVVLRAGAAAGWENAIQTLRQLMPPDRLGPPTADPIAFPCVSIEDAPRFHWRGLLLDCSRHFFDKAYIEKFLDVMALNKLNVFHWHLTDSQSWRLEIKKYPLLTEAEAKSTLDDKLAPTFYTQNDAREIVRYAALRNITVVPEIDMPGHSHAAIASYPFLSCASPGETTNNGDEYAALNVGNERTYQFIDDVLSEVAEIFPSAFIHVGGDEVNKKAWLANADCQALMKAQDLKDGDALQSYFTRRVQAMLTAKGKRLMAWDEILKGGLVPGAAIMIWHGKVGPEAIASGDDMVLTPGNPLYFDLNYTANSLERIYAYNPAPPALTSEQAQHVLGAQGNIWTESISYPTAVDDRTYPRACALAEITWSSQPLNFNDFKQRLDVHLKRLDALGVHYHDTSYKELSASSYASWGGNSMPKTGNFVEWKATGTVVGNKTNYVRFEATGGVSPLEINGVDILADNVVIASDPHHGITGGDDKDNVFVLSVPALAPDAKITLRATFAGEHWRGSSGNIGVKQ